MGYGVKNRKQCKKTAGRIIVRLRASVALCVVSVLAVKLLTYLLETIMLQILTSPYTRFALVFGISLFSFFVLVPVIAGFMRVIYVNCEGRLTRASDIFYYFESIKRYFKLIGLVITVGIRIGLMFIPAAAFIAADIYMIIRLELFDADTIFLMVFLALAAVLLFFISLYFSLRYFLCPILFFNRENFKIKGIISVSAYLMKNNKGKVFALVMSMIPLLILCVFILPAFIILPYTVAVFTVYGTMNVNYIFMHGCERNTTVFKAGEVV